MTDVDIDVKQNG